MAKGISGHQTKVIKQSGHKTSKPSADDAVRTAIKSITPQKPLPNQQISDERLKITH